jgi:hypothetical protein
MRLTETIRQCLSKANFMQVKRVDMRTICSRFCFLPSLGLMVGLSLISLLQLSPCAAFGAGGEKSAVGLTTAWQNGQFNINVRGVVGRSDIILLRPSRVPEEAMPLGNGRLGLGVWGQDGYTAQLNREDTLPKRLSPAQVVIPGLAKLTDAADYKGRLDLYNGELVESGAGMTATTYVDDSVDVMVVDVTGADPGVTQTAELRLWPPRKPSVIAADKIAVLEETWRDTTELGSTGLTFGSVAGITADARDVHAEAAGSLTARVTFRPNADGSFRIYVTSPQWVGADPVGTSSTLIEKAKQAGIQAHRAWWHQLWASVDLIRLSSADHTAEYFENLRTIDIFTIGAESRDRLPGGQAGIGDLFSSYKGCALLGSIFVVALESAHAGFGQFRSWLGRI